MFCTNCGKEINNGAVFCPNCGMRVAQTASTLSEPLKQSKNNSKDGIESKVKVVIAIAVISWVIIIGYIIADSGMEWRPQKESPSFSYLLVGQWIGVDKEYELLSFSEDGELKVKDTRTPAYCKRYPYRADENNLYITIEDEEVSFAEYEIEDDILMLTIDDEDYEYIPYDEQKIVLCAVTWVDLQEGLALQFDESGQVRIESYNDIIQSGVYTYSLPDNETIRIYTDSGAQKMNYGLNYGLDNNNRLTLNIDGVAFVLTSGEFDDLSGYQQSAMSDWTETEQSEAQNRVETELTLGNYQQYVNITTEYRTGWYRVKINIDPLEEAEFENVNITFEAVFEYALSGSKTESGEVKLSRNGEGYLEIRDWGADSTINGGRPATLSYYVRVADISGKVIE